MGKENWQRGKSIEKVLIRPVAHILNRVNAKSEFARVFTLIIAIIEGKTIFILNKTSKNKWWMLSKTGMRIHISLCKFSYCYIIVLYSYILHWIPLFCEKQQNFCWTEQHLSISWKCLCIMHVLRYDWACTISLKGLQHVHGTSSGKTQKILIMLMRAQDLESPRILWPNTQVES